MSGFTVNNEMAGSAQNLTTTYKTQIMLGVPASLPRRMRVFEIELSATGVPNATDCPIQGDFLWCTGAVIGTNTAATPWPKDSGTAIGTQVDTAVSKGYINWSAEPTVYGVANSWWFRAFNQRSGVLWQAAPGHEIVLPASAQGTTVSTGAGLRALSPNYASTVAARTDFDEL
jgi:hypothetical protein